MRDIIMQVIFIGGIIYGMVTLIKTLMKSEKDQYQLSISITLIIVSAASLWMNL